jgi:hypothetical protein
MAYINADTLLPPELIEEIQKYVQGSLVYIPRPLERRLGWGRKNGTREELDKRNAAIRAAKRDGRTVDDLADEYHLSPDGIRKILYGPRRELAARLVG